ncbi:hypothetical protein PPYC1_16320 [Paenibacillus polymyxa]|jgi:hypothetical protein|uniref:hypothetical protein n=1 Tax=Paenibacillus polymyxa TaxID=1406 RepID=UPI0008FCC77B|nr:hypothetical protein [Paenibacillus polymyxa]APB71834.1 hypothetical protein PPYC1_16320 [Paenibacillus polymyxa]
MSKVDQLSVRAKASLSHYIDAYIRERLGFLQGDFSDADIDAIYTRIIWRYKNITPRKDSDYIAEIKEQINNSNEFNIDLKEHIVSWVENRPTTERHDYYKSLCLQYGLHEKQMIRPEHLEGRIAKIIKTNGASQNYR